jgi:hypothetical protein
MNEEKEDLNLGDYPGLHSGPLRLQLRGATGQVWPNYAYWHTNANANSDTNPDSNTDPNANTNPNSNPNTHANANSDPSSRPASPCPYPATGNERDTESRHPGRSGSVDHLIDLDAHQSSARNPSEHWQRPVHRGIRELPTGSCRLPDGLWLGHDLDSYHRRVQYHTSSFRRLL